MHFDFDLDENSYNIENVKLVPDNGENEDRLQNACFNLRVTNPAKTFADLYKSNQFSNVPDKATISVVNACNTLANIFSDKVHTPSEESEPEENICTLFVRLCKAYLDMARLYDEDYDYQYPEDALYF